MRKQYSIFKNIDWITIGLFMILAIMGWLNIYAAIYDPELNQSMFDMTNKAGKQFYWVVFSIVIILIITILDFKFYLMVPYLIYGFFMLLLAGVLIFGKEINGAKAWYDFGFIRLQPSEFAKFATGLALAKYLSTKNIKYDFSLDTAIAIGILFIPAVLILLQPDAGSVLIYGSFIIVLFIDGLPVWIPLLGIAGAFLFILALTIPTLILFISILAIALIIFFIIKKTRRNILLLVFSSFIVAAIVFGTERIIEKLPKHQQNRIAVLIDPESDPKGAGWNIIQSKIAIGSGGLNGKGFTEGTITKFDFVPEQHTDFIFCTIGEEHGWIGSFVLIGLYCAFLLRLVHLAERQKYRFVKLYGYGMVGIFFFHFLVNIGMTIGLFPVIGIPLPFFSYGGSSLWGFTILLFIFLKLDANRSQLLARS